MSRSTRRDTGEPCFPAKSPSFFKIVLAGALRDGKIEIPEGVVMKHGNCLAESVLLKDPSGAEWRIELTRSEGEVWLEKGWPKFAKFYSLDHGYLLVFSCEGDFSCFQVRIFNRNTMEIDYPMKPSHGVMEELEDDDVSVEILDSVPAKRRGSTELASLWPRKTMRTRSGDKAKVKSYPSGVMEELEDDDVSVEILDSVPAKRRGRTELASLWPRKTMRTRSGEKAKVKSTYPSGETKDQAVKHHREKRSYGSPSSRKSCKEDGGSMPTALTSLRANEHSVDTRDGAYLRATSFKYDNPFLVVKMQDSYIKQCLKIQGVFAEAYICARGVRRVNLQNLDGRTWRTTCAVEVWNNRVDRRRQVQGRVAWKSFVQDNNLKVGDACVFELKKGSKVPTFKVHIFRAEDAGIDA